MAVNFIVITNYLYEVPHCLVNILGWQFLIVFHSLGTLGVYKTERCLYTLFCPYPRLFPCARKRKQTITGGN